MHFSYKVYGRSLSSDLRLPELANTARLSSLHRPFVMVLFDPRPEAEPTDPQWFLENKNPDGEPWLRCARIGERYLLSYCNVADFVLDAREHQILCTRVARDTSEATLRHVVLDSVLPLFMNLVGHDALHATGVETSSGAIAFLGRTGTGKSTLAASFVQRGFRLFCDDCLVLEERTQIVGIPGYWGLRLWSDSRQALRIDNQTANSKSRSMASRADELLCREAMPLARIYFLTREPGARQPRIEPIAGRQAVAQLVEAAYRLEVNDKAMLARQFNLLSRLAREAPVKRLVLPDDFSSLPAVHHAVLEDLVTGDPLERRRLRTLDGRESDA